MRVARQLRHLSQQDLLRTIRDGLAYVDPASNTIMPTISGAATCTAGFETGVNGNNIATSDAGNATAWDTVVLGTGLTYDNTHAHSGTLAGKMAGDSTTPPTLTWSTAIGTNTDHYGRMYLWLPSLPPASGVSLNRTTNSGTQCTNLVVDNVTGQIFIRGAANTNLANTTAAVSTAQWIRIEWHIVHSTTVGSYEVKLFNSPEATSPTETVAFTNQDTGVSSNTMEFRNNRTFNVWFDDIVAGAASYPGPLGSSPAVVTSRSLLGVGV